MSDRTGADCMLLYHQEGDEQHLKAAQRIHFLEERIKELEAQVKKLREALMDEVRDEVIERLMEALEQK